MTTEIRACKTRITELLEKGQLNGEDNILRVQYFLHTLHVFEVEFLVYMKEWDQLTLIIEASFQLSRSFTPFE